MTAAVSDNWEAANQQYLMAALDVLRGALERHAARPENKLEPGGGAADRLEQAARQMPAPPALERLCVTFGLSRFERDVLLLCAGMDLDAGFAALCAAAHGDPSRSYPTFSLALAALPGAHWSAITPGAPLRHWRLIEAGGAGPLTTGPLRIDERILHYLAGTAYLDERLAGLVEPLVAAGELTPSHRELSDRLARAWARASKGLRLPVVQLTGGERAGKRAIAAAACSEVGLLLNVMPANALPPAAGELEGLIRLWEREASLSGSALLLDCEDMDADPARSVAVASLIERLRGPLIVCARERRRSWQRPMITLDVHKPTAGEQRAVWRRAVGAGAAALDGQVDGLVSQFSLSPPDIHAASAEALGLLSGANGETLGALLWDACRDQARPRLDDLAQRIDPAAGWDDLVLPEPQTQILREIAAHVRHRATVYESWGFAARSPRGLGISTLFAGSSGTGKTMAAEVLARELRLDLYRIDLSQVVSKYIGETEKNLRKVFDAAEEGGAILLFDEADALFGKRSEVKDSHDRYANIEVSYLLQRMESYRGLAILTTNMKQALDPAFLRRIRFIVEFPFPDAAQRLEIWRRIFPARTPTEGLQPALLARLNVAGGSIRNIALNAAFLAADEKSPVRMTHLLRAARAEYMKLEKPLTEAEIGGWA